MTVVRSLAVGTLLLLLSVGAVMGQSQAQAPASSAPAGDVERGRYLVEQVVMCGECHSTRDAQGVIVPNLKFRGGPMLVGPPSWAGEDWPLYVPRIAGLPGYSDAEAIRLLTQGAIGRKGQQLRPPMPRFRMSREDAAAVIAYLRTR